MAKMIMHGPKKAMGHKKPFARIEEDDFGGHKVTTGYEHSGPMIMGDHGYEAPKERVFEKGKGHHAMSHAANHMGVANDTEEQEAGSPDGGSGLNMNPAIDAAQ